MVLRTVGLALGPYSVGAERSYFTGLQLAKGPISQSYPCSRSKCLNTICLRHDLCITLFFKIVLKYSLRSSDRCYMEKDLISYLNQCILKKTNNLKYIVKDHAPNTFIDLKNESSLVIWSGESDVTIYNDPMVNYAFRAMHDNLHLSTGLDFSHASEIALGRIQANQFDSSIVQDIVFCEVAGQALYHEKTGLFVSNQVEFTEKFLKNGLKF